MHWTSTITILRFLITPETTSPGSGHPSIPCESRGWQMMKAVFWIGLGVIGAVMIGQL